jgi:general secretion pathway protein I
MKFAGAPVIVRPRAGVRSFARRQAGFTLLEVMLAFVILAAAMGLLISMLSNGLRQVSQAQNETEATLYAQSLLDQIGLLEPIAVGRKDGEFDHGRYRYELEISQTQDPVPAQAKANTSAGPTTTVGGPIVYRVALLVRWGANQPAQQLRFVTLRARAAPPEQAAAP